MASVTRNVTAKLVTNVEVPVMIPALLRVKPAGNWFAESGEIDHEYGRVPRAAAIVNVYARPEIAGVTDDVVIAKPTGCDVRFNVLVATLLRLSVTVKMISWLNRTVAVPEINPPLEMSRPWNGWLWFQDQVNGATPPALSIWNE